MLYLFLLISLKRQEDSASLIICTICLLVGDLSSALHGIMFLRAFPSYTP